MAGADGGAGPGPGPGWRWDVALSFAGAQRDYVRQVAATLKARGVRCFYDADEQVRLWGTHLAEELPRIYARESAAVVVFISADYAGRDWTRLERRAAFSRAVTEAGVYVLPARFDDCELPGLLPDVAAVDLRRYTPGQFADLIAAKLADLAISPPPPPGRAGRAPTGGIPVGEADPRRLGVHAAISVPGVPEEVPPEYVPRDVDAAEFGVRAKVAAAARRGGFVLLVGGSSVGKTRCAAEAVKALLPDWWLVHPAGPGEVAALAAAPPPRTVVWLDELQRYLDGEHGLTGAVIRALLDVPHPAVIIGTLWPDRYAAYTALPAPGGTDPHARERDVLDLAAVIRIDPEFSPAEQSRARAAAARDRRLAIALEADGYGLTQTLAAAPQLVARWQDAQAAAPYAWAVLTAAVDTARLGARAPLSTGLLRAAAPGYCTSAQQAEAPENWFEQALAYATGKLHGAVAALSPAGSRMGQVDGYTVADYLLQHAGRERRTARVPASTWDALLSHIRDPADTARLADSAQGRLLYCYAIPLYRHAADAGGRYAALRLVGLLAERGDLDELGARADAGDESAAVQLADLLAERGDLDGLRARADSGDGYAAVQLADLLAEPGDLDRLRARADAGDESAAVQLANLLRERGDLDGLRARADSGDGYAAAQLAALLAERGDLDGLRARADSGHGYAAARLAGLLAERGDLDGAVQILRALADAGDESAAVQLVGLLAERGDLDGAVQILRARADAGNKSAASRLADLLAERGDLDGLRALADAGHWHAASWLALLLAERGDLDGLRARADAGDKSAASRLAALLAERGDLDELGARADAGDEFAASRLAALLAERGDLDGLRALADAGYGDARRLASLLMQQGHREEADRLRRFGLKPDGSIACG
jgi:TIR domain